MMPRDFSDKFLQGSPQHLWENVAVIPWDSGTWFYRDQPSLCGDLEL